MNLTYLQIDTAKAQYRNDNVNQQKAFNPYHLSHLPKTSKKMTKRRKDINLLYMGKDEADCHLFIQQQKKQLVYLKTICEKLHNKKITENCFAVEESKDELGH